MDPRRVGDAVASESHLIAASREGSTRAFEELVRRHQLGVYRVALRLLGSPEDAEEAAQEAFVQAWRALANFREGSRFATWIYRIVTNRALNLIAARRGTESLDPEMAARGDDLGESAATRERLDETLAALHSIAPSERALIVLREFEGLSYRDMAEITETKPSIVKGRLHRARSALVEAMEDQ